MKGKVPCLLAICSFGEAYPEQGQGDDVAMASPHLSIGLGLNLAHTQCQAHSHHRHKNNTPIEGLGGLAWCPRFSIA